MGGVNGKKEKMNPTDLEGTTLCEEWRRAGPLESKTTTGDNNQGPTRHKTIKIKEGRHKHQMMVLEGPLTSWLVDTQLDPNPHH